MPGTNNSDRESNHPDAPEEEAGKAEAADTAAIVANLVDKWRSASLGRPTLVAQLWTQQLEAI